MSEGTVQPTSIWICKPASDVKPFLQVANEGHEDDVIISPPEKSRNNSILNSQHSIFWSQLIRKWKFFLEQLSNIAQSELLTQSYEESWGKTEQSTQWKLSWHLLAMNVVQGLNSQVCGVRILSPKYREAAITFLGKF